jgi:hypothetical protein
MASSSSSPNSPPPAECAAEIVDRLLSHPGLITKTSTAILGSGLLTTAISQELYVFNEETVIAVGYFMLFAYIAKVRRVSFPPSTVFLPPFPFTRLLSGVGRSIFNDRLPLCRRCSLSVVLEGRLKGCCRTRRDHRELPFLDRRHATFVREAESALLPILRDASMLERWTERQSIIVYICFHWIASPEM